jgi:hypothetical protein
MRGDHISIAHIGSAEDISTGQHISAAGPAASDSSRSPRIVCVILRASLETRENKDANDSTNTQRRGTIRCPHDAAGARRLHHAVVAVFGASTAFERHGIRDREIRGFLSLERRTDPPFELFKRGVLCHSVSEIEPRVVKFFPCLTSSVGVVEEGRGGIERFCAPLGAAFSLSR